MFFKNNSYIAYKDSNDVKHILTDIMSRIYYKSGFDNEKALYTLYDVREGERPEDVSFKFYGSQEYHWVILLFNEIINSYEEWYMTEQQVIDIAQSKYSDIYAIHHHEKDGFINSTGMGKLVTNLDYEISLNESKRRVKILNNIHLKIFLDEYRKKL